MPLDAMFTLGPFSVDDSGRLSPSEPDCFPAFRVKYRGREVTTRMVTEAATPPGQQSLQLTVVLGRVPSTAGHPEGCSAPRPALFGVLRGLPALLPPGWRMALLADHRVALETIACVQTPTPATELVTAVTLFLIELCPYLDLLEESGIG